MRVATLKFDYNQSQLGKNMEKFAEKLGAAVLIYAGTKAALLESQMKRERPWTDRTGMAKATLRSVVTRPDQNTVRITLAHGVWYGKWLELAHEKKWAIVAPTIEKEAPNIVNDLSDLMSKINF
jgi:hypothetical protein